MGVKELIKDIEVIFDDDKVPAASIEMVSGKRTLWVGSLDDVLNYTGATADTLIRVLSIRKSYGALAVTKLVEHGFLASNTPVHGLILDVEYFISIALLSPF